ncbi:transposase [Burkholderia ubonensis]|nr:IS91 family transposase [Burkholderia ubonensis]KVO84247.1 transposase [Burkholderia ubonensis]KVZ69192.1 transposase [Burkholderia ubonensis]KVZ73585.1 transposase [Burkholderia ubonensis]KWO88018.1 transposase [Burkholderia ubonensis]OJB22109.1 transposase [Burkholderia ubonensis]
MMRAALELADVLRRHGPTYRDVHADSLSRAQRRVMSAIEQCRTAVLGGHVEQCDTCGHQRIAYNSCRNRHCPKCQSLARAQWLDDRQSDLLPVPYFHVVFTIPEQIASIAFQNKGVVYDILFQATAETLHTIAADPRHLGAIIGFIAILHTWGQNLVHHPHLHCVVPGGGLAPDGTRWVACKPGFFLPVRVLSRLFRRLFLERLQHAFDVGDLRFFSSLAHLAERGEFARYLAGLRHAEWVVYAKEPFGGSQQVLDYLGRYTHRVAISNNRLVGLSEGHVTFRWKDYRHPGRARVMRLDAHEFIRRFLLHVLPRGLQRIRHYGLLSNRLRESQLVVCRQLLDVAPTSEARSAPEPDYRDRYEKLTGRSLYTCPVCTRGRMHCIDRLFPGAAPRPPPAILR